MPYEFKAERRVEFADTDMAGIMHYSNFFRFMETAEHGFYRSLGYSVVMKQFDPPVAWPRVHAECDYFKPLHFEERVEIQLLIESKRSKTITYLFRFWKIEEAPPVEAARGRLVVVCVRHQSDGSMAAAKIPKALADQLVVAPADVLPED